MEGYDRLLNILKTHMKLETFLFITKMVPVKTMLFKCFKKVNQIIEFFRVTEMKRKHQTFDNKRLKNKEKQRIYNLKVCEHMNL